MVESDSSWVLPAQFVQHKGMTHLLDYLATGGNHLYSTPREKLKEFSQVDAIPLLEQTRRPLG